MILKTVRGKTPTYGNACFFAETAVIIGDVMLGDQCSVWFHAVIRGDVHHIRIGNRVNIQDGAVIHATFERSPTTIGNRVSIGHNALVHGCTIHDNVLIGMGAIVMDDCIIESKQHHRCGSGCYSRHTCSIWNNLWRSSSQKIKGHSFSIDRRRN